MATYALFGAVALGMLAQITGSGAQRARTLLAVLPVGSVLVTAGTLLSVANWTAALGMVALGFLVNYVGVGGPRIAGPAAGAQLLYILPCFPPYDPSSLGYRLAGLTIAVVLLAIAERVLWPEPAPMPYEYWLAAAVSALAGCLDALADALDGEPEGRNRVAALLPDASEAAEAIRPSRLPAAQRPASASRRDRALGHAGSSLRRSLASTVDLFFENEPEPLSATAAATLLRQASTTARETAAWLRGSGAPPPDVNETARAIAAFRAARLRVVPDAVHPDRLRLGSLALVIGDGIKVLATASRVAGGAPIAADDTPPGAQPGPFWYAHRPTVWLWWHRFREHLTPRSVYFQGALRLAVALAVARLLAGELDLSHGFWVLLATLTLLRTSAAETRSALRPALVGTIVGAALAGGLLVVGAQPQVYVVALPLVMLLGFAAGPLLGPGWAQALFTVVIALVFAQVAPVDWRLAEARALDVAVGAAVGVLIGLFAWPRGGAGELHRATANFLVASGSAIRETVAVLTAATPPGTALPRARAQATGGGVLRAVPDRAPRSRPTGLAGEAGRGPPRGTGRGGVAEVLPDRPARALCRAAGLHRLGGRLGLRPVRGRTATAHPGPGHPVRTGAAAVAYRPRYRPVLPGGHPGLARRPGRRPRPDLRRAGDAPGPLGRARPALGMGEPDPVTGRPQGGVGRRRLVTAGR